MKFCHKPSFALSYNFGVLLIELCIKNVESWGQTLGMWLFGLQVWTCRPPGPTSRQGRKTKIHNSIIWIWGRNHEILCEKPHRSCFVNPWYRNPNICTDHTDGLTALPLGSQGPRTKDRWPRTKDQGPRTKDHGPWDQGPRTKDQGSRIKDQGSRIKDLGPRT